MAITLADFTKIWASTSPLTPYTFSDPNYAEGWNFIGGTPPSRQMWDFLQKNNDEKMKFIVDNFAPIDSPNFTGTPTTPTPLTDDDSTKIANTQFVKAIASILTPVGSVTAFAGSTTPTGWLLCDGSAVSRTDYADLYAVIGDTYGAGDGSTTFNVPNLVNKFVEGSATSGTEKTAGVPNITGYAYFRNQVNDYRVITDVSGAIYRTAPTVSNYAPNAQGSPSTTVACGLEIDASRSSSIYGNSTTVQPPAVTMRYIIKY